MSLESSWNDFKNAVVAEYKHLTSSNHQTIENLKTVKQQRIEKFEIDHHLKSPPTDPKLPYIELHDQQVNTVLKKAGDYSETITVDGRQRHFILHVPSSYDTSAKGAAIPLIVALHGFTQSASEFQSDAGLDRYADAKNVAILYPEATKWLGIDVAAAWYTGNGLTPLGARVDDVGFIRKTIGIAEEQIKVDRNRVDLLGVSNGGMMAYKAATEMSDVVAAVVDISGAMSGQEKRPKNPISVMSVVGTKDEIVPPTGRTREQEVNAINQEMQELLSGMGSERFKKFVASERGKDLGRLIVEQSNYAPTFKPVSYATEFWKKTDGITTKSIITNSGSVHRDLYQNISTGVAVEQVVLTGMDHAAQAGVPRNFKLNDEAWNFLAAHPKYHAQSK